MLNSAQRLSEIHSLKRHEMRGPASRFAGFRAVAAAQVAAAKRKGHMSGVPRALTTLLMLAALLLMPMGMAGVPAAAAASPESPALSSHCDGHGDKQDHAPASMEQHCATCNVMPATEGPQLALPIAPRAPLSARAATAFSGVDLEVSTPPPRRA
jgi:hypothetical protein